MKKGKCNPRCQRLEDQCQYGHKRAEICSGDACCSFENKKVKWRLEDRGLVDSRLGKKLYSQKPIGFGLKCPDTVEFFTGAVERIEIRRVAENHYCYE
jgi:hypothetical protein